MYANEEESDTESASKATTSGRSTGTKLAPLQVTPKPQPKTRTLKVVSSGSIEEKTDEQPTKRAEATNLKKTESSSQPADQQQQNRPETKPDLKQRPQQPAPTIIKPVILPKTQQQATQQKPQTSQQTREEQRTAAVVHEPPQKQSIRRPSRDQDHLSIACHLFPRLSETNLNFHDIYWGVDPKTQRIFLRKRMVNVSKIFYFHSLQPTKRPAQTPSADESTGFKLNVYLVDLRPRAEQQIVSNVHVLSVPIQPNRFGFFCQKAVAKPILVRSNYKQPEVILRIELFQSFNSLGIADIPLLDTKQESRLSQRTQTLAIGHYKLSFDSSDPSAKFVGQADSLPDILICYEEWIPMLATFRQLSAEVLANREKQQQTTWIIDPVLATFPTVCESQRLIDLFLLVLSKKQRFSTSTFRRTFMQYIYPVVHTLQLDSDKQTTDYRLWLEKNSENPVGFMSAEKCTPLNIFHYSVHLSGYHAID